jgi:phosphatidylglycerophosphate synthase
MQAASRIRMVRQIPNAISLARLALTPFLAVAAATDHCDVFRWILLACLLSDILDGWIARAFDLRSRLGARLDSIADLLVEVAALFGLWMFHREIILAHRGVLACAVGIYVGQILLSLWRYGRISSFHTLLNRVAAYAQGIFFITLFFWGYSELVFYAAVSLAILGAAEEIVIVYLLREWTPDVGGLYRILSRRRTASR